jgi:preprotein translocase subunit SecG
VHDRCFVLVLVVVIVLDKAASRIDVPNQRVYAKNNSSVFRSVGWKNALSRTRTILMRLVSAASS